MLLLGIVLLGGLLLIPFPVEKASVKREILRDALHFPCFVFLFLLIYATLRRIRSEPRGCTLLLAVLLTCGVGGASEWAQSLIPSRSASWHDFVSDLLGVVAGSATVIGSWFIRSRWFLFVLIPLTGVLVASVVPVARPLILVLKAENRQADAFPHLGDFEEDWEDIFWYAEGFGGGPTIITPSSLHATRGKQSLKVETVDSTWAGARVAIGQSLTWPGARSLKFDVFNPGDQFNMEVVLFGFEGSKFFGVVSITPGDNQCVLRPAQLKSKNRDLTLFENFSAKQIIFGLGGSPATRTLYLDNVRVE